MRILVWGINYAPEPTGIAPYNAALCDYLRGAGHAVGMVTSFPYYPAWRKERGDAGRLFRRDEVRGVPVYRCWHYVPARVSTLRRILHEGSFVLTSLVRLLGLRRPDVYVVVSPPLLLGAAAWILGRLKGAPFVFHVQDLQPDAAVGLGMLKPSRFTRALYRLEALAYRRAARVSGISEGMLRAFERKQVPVAKRVFFPNGVKLPALEALPPKGRFRAAHGVPADHFLAVYSGNLGMKQGLEVVIEAAELLRERPVSLLICGDGARRAALEESVRERRLGNVRLLPLQPEAQYREMLVDADVCLITQQAGSGAAFFPSKLLAALAHAKPVLAVADEDSELTRALTVGGFGEAVRPDDPGGLAAGLLQMARHRQRLTQQGEAGRRFVARYQFETVHREFERTLLAVAAAASQ